MSSLTGRVVQTFEDPVSRDFPESLYQQSLKLQSIYQKAVPLRPGLYRLDIVIKDVKSGNVGVVNTRLQVPRFEDDKLEASSLIVADGGKLEHVPSKQIGTGQFVLGSTKVVPRLDAEFPNTEKLGIYMQIYNLKPDDKTHKSSATFLYTVKKGDQQIMQFKETSEEMKQTGEQVTIERLLPLATLTPASTRWKSWRPTPTRRRRFPNPRAFQSSPQSIPRRPPIRASRSWEVKRSEADTILYSRRFGPRRNVSVDLRFRGFRPAI